MSQRRLIVQRSLLAVFFAVLLGIGIVSGFVLKHSVENHQSFVQSAVQMTAQAVVEKPQDHFHKDRINVLLLGIDYNYNEKDIEYSDSARSDTIMAVSVNFPTPEAPHGSVGIISVPRDMDVVAKNGSEDKINAAYASGGAPKSEAVVADYLGLPGFDRYITLRIDATKELIDAIGGIDITPDETMNYDDSWGHLHIHFIGGKKYHMNGEEAVSYSRFRHDACGDPCRIKRQQVVLRTAVNKLKSDQFNDLVHIGQLIAVIRKNVYTNLSPAEMKSIAFAMSQLDVSSIKTEQVPYLEDKDLACCGNVLISDDVSKRKLVKQIFLDPIMPTVSPDPAAVAAVLPKSIRVSVRNGSGQPGLARELAQTLKARGYTIADVGNADTTSYDATEVHVHPTAVPLAGERVRSSLDVKGAVVTTDDGTADPQSDVTVIVGRDYPVKPPVATKKP